jgi:hypothetical protein
VLEDLDLTCEGGMVCCTMELIEQMAQDEHGDRQSRVFVMKPRRTVTKFFLLYICQSIAITSLSVICLCCPLAHVPH